MNSGEKMETEKLQAVVESILFTLGKQVEIKKLAEDGKSDMLAFLEKYFDTDEFVKCKYKFVNEYEDSCEYVDKTKTSTYDMIEYTVKYKNSKYYVKYNPKTKEIVNVDKDIRVE